MQSANWIENKHSFIHSFAGLSSVVVYIKAGEMGGFVYTYVHANTVLFYVSMCCLKQMYR